MGTYHVLATRHRKQRQAVVLASAALCLLLLSAAPGVRAQGLTLRYQWQKGDTAATTIVVEGRGEARQVKAVVPLSLSAAIEAREEVARLSTGETAVITTTWQSADLVIDGDKVSLVPGEAVLEKRIGSLGEGYWSRSRGRGPSVRAEREPVLLDAEHLALIDLLVEQVEYPLLSPQPVKVDDTWEVREPADFGGQKVELRKTIKLLSVGTGAEAGVCHLETTIAAPISFDLPGEGLHLAGKIGGTFSCVFDNAHGRLSSGEGMFEFDLAANPVEGAVGLPPAGEPNVPATEGGGGKENEEAAGTDLFRLKMQFMVRVTRKFPRR